MLKQKQYPWTFIISLIAILILYEAFDNSLVIIKGFLFAQILIFTGYYDAKTKVIPDVIHILIAGISLISISPGKAIIGILVGIFPFLIVGIIFGGIGGGDIKRYVNMKHLENNGLESDFMVGCVFRRHPDTDSGNIRTAYRDYPDSISGTSGHLVELTN